MNESLKTLWRGGHKNAAGGEVRDMMEAITSFLSFIKEDNPKKRTLAEKQRTKN